MAKLTYAEYSKLPMSSFASKKVISAKEAKDRGISKKNLRKSGGKLYWVQLPIQDKSHARNALARANQAEGLKPKQESAARTKAYEKLYGKKKRK